MQCKNEKSFLFYEIQTCANTYLRPKSNKEYCAVKLCLKRFFLLYSISTYLRSPERLKLFELSCLWNRKLSLQFCNHLLYFKHSFWTDKLIQFLAYYAHELWVLLSVICNLTKNHHAKISLHLYICQLKYT